MRGAPAGTASKVLLAEAGGTAEPSGPPADLLSQRLGPQPSSLCQCVQRCPSVPLAEDWLWTWGAVGVGEGMVDGKGLLNSTTPKPLLPCSSHGESGGSPGPRARGRMEGKGACPKGTGRKAGRRDPIIGVSGRSTKAPLRTLPLIPLGKVLVPVVFSEGACSFSLQPCHPLGL